MDGVSAAASIVGIATAGIQISIKVVTLAGQISTASDRVSSIGNDISLTSAILHQLGDLIGQKTSDDSPGIFSKGGLETTKNSAEICQRIFREVEKETAKASEILRGRKQRIGEKIKLSVIEKARWPFLQPGLETLRIDLREAKGTLMLMLQVASLALSKRVADMNASTSSNVTEQQDIIRSILILQQQKQQQKSQDIASTCEDPAKSPGTPEIGALQNLSKIKPPNNGVSKTTHSRVSGESEQEASRFPPAIASSSIPRNRQDPRRPSQEIQRSNNQRRADGLNNSSNSKNVELHMVSIDPHISVRNNYPEIVLDWTLSELKIPESLIRDRLKSEQVDGMTSVLDKMESMEIFERAALLQAFNESAFRKDKNQIISLKRTERDWQQGSIKIKAIPCFSLILEREVKPRSMRYSPTLQAMPPYHEPRSANIEMERRFYSEEKPVPRSAPIHSPQRKADVSPPSPGLSPTSPCYSPTGPCFSPTSPSFSAGAEELHEIEPKSGRPEVYDEELARLEKVSVDGPPAGSEDDRKSESAEIFGDDEGDMATVDKLLARYTTLFL